MKRIFLALTRRWSRTEKRFRLCEEKRYMLGHCSLTLFEVHHSNCSSLFRCLGWMVHSRSSVFSLKSTQTNQIQNKSWIPPCHARVIWHLNSLEHCVLSRFIVFIISSSACSCGLSGSSQNSFSLSSPHTLTKIGHIRHFSLILALSNRWLACSHTACSS